MMLIYFTDRKEACAFEVENPMAVVDESIWALYCEFKLGEAYDVVPGQFVQLWSPQFCAEKRAARSRISELKMNLLSTDYKTLKYIDGLYTEEEWAAIKAERQAWRDEINALENLVPY